MFYATYLEHTFVHVLSGAVDKQGLGKEAGKHLTVWLANIDIEPRLIYNSMQRGVVRVDRHSGKIQGASASARALGLH